MKNKLKVIARKKLFLANETGKIGMPVLMYLLGVPGVVCLLAWFFFFRN